MHKALSRLVGALAFVTPVVVALGCGSGGGPTAPNAQQLAAHFDSLYEAAVLAGNHGDSLRSLVITYLEIATADGATPVPVTVTTAAGNATWQALSFEIADTSGDSVAYSLTATVVYSDNSVTNAVFAEVTTGHNAHDYAEMVASDTVYAADSTATALATVTNHGTCKSPSGYSNPIFTTIDTMYHCNLATFQSGLNAKFSGPGVPSSLAQISFSNLTSNGVRLSDATP